MASVFARTVQETLSDCAQLRAERKTPPPAGPPSGGCRRNAPAAGCILHTEAAPNGKLALGSATPP